MEVLGRRMRELFVRRSMARLRRTFPSETAALSEAQLRSLVLSMIERAARHSVVIENDVQRFIDFSLIYGPEFDTDARRLWIRQILQDAKLDGTAKMDRIQLRHELEKVGTA